MADAGPEGAPARRPDEGGRRGRQGRVLQDTLRPAGKRVAILLHSSDDEELLGLCDRVLVMRDGVVRRELSGDDLNKSALVSASVGSSPPTERHERGLLGRTATPGGAEAVVRLCAVLLVVTVAINYYLQPNFFQPGLLSGNLLLFVPLMLVAVGRRSS